MFKNRDVGNNSAIEYFHSMWRALGSIFRDAKSSRVVTVAGMYNRPLSWNEKTLSSHLLRNSYIYIKNELLEMKMLRRNS